MIGATREQQERALARARERLHTSVSELNDMILCGQRWLYDYVLDMRVRQKTPAQARGIALHEAGAKSLRLLRDTGTPLTPSEMDDAVVTEFDAVRSRDGFRFTSLDNEEGPAKIIGSTKDAAVRFGRVHSEKFTPTVNPRDVELKVTSEPMDVLDGRYLTGRLDLTHNLIPDDERTPVIIRDVKTTSRKMAPETVAGSVQLMVYAVLYRMAFGIAPDGVMIDALVVTPGGKTKEPDRYHQPLPIQSPTEQQLDATLERLARVQRLRRLGVAPPPASPDSWVCSERYCSHTSYCPFYVRAADRSAR